MTSDTSQRIVRFDLIMACVTIANGFVLVSSMGVQPTDVVAGATVAVVTTVLCTSADRSRLGLWVFVAAGALVITGLVTAGTESWVFAVIPGGMVGLGVGWLLNRVLFGVVGSVPETRVERGLGRLG